MNSFLIRLQDVSKEFGQGSTVVQALDGVTWNLTDRGKLVALVGPSGSGKTTLLNLIGALDVPTRGQVIVEGTDLGRLTERELTEYRREKVGFVFQSYNLIPNLSVVENVMLPMEFTRTPRLLAKSRAVKLLDEVTLQHRQDHKPAALSGGEQQRVAVARALANDPDIILADEPTGNLDTKTGKEIIRLLKELAHTKTKTVIVVTHDEGIVEIADEQSSLRDGKIVQI